MSIVQVCAWTHKLSSHKAEEAVNTQVLCSNKGRYIQMNKHERKKKRKGRWLSSSIVNPFPVIQMSQDTCHSDVTRHSAEFFLFAPFHGAKSPQNESLFMDPNVILSMWPKVLKMKVFSWIQVILSTGPKVLRMKVFSWIQKTFFYWAKSPQNEHLWSA